VRLRMPSTEEKKKEQKSTETSKQKRLRVRKPKRRKLDLEPEARKVVNELEASFVSANLRLLEIRKYEGDNKRTFLVWMYTDPGEVAIEGSGDTLSQAIASLLNATRKLR
jgi:hypothetical protein